MLSKLTWEILQIFTKARLRKSKNWNLDGILLSKVENLLGIYVSLQRRIMQNLNRNCLSVQNWYEEFDEYRPEHMKISKFCTLMGCFWPKYIMFELKKACYVWLHWGVMFDCTEDWCKIWRKTDLCFLKWHEEFGKF